MKKFYFIASLLLMLMVGVSAFAYLSVPSYQSSSGVSLLAEAEPTATLTAEPDVINFWGFSTTGESYYNTHNAKFHVTAENCTENITYVMQSSGKSKGSTSPRVTVATAGLYEAKSGDLKVTCNTSTAVDVSDVVIIKSGDAEANVTVNVKIVETQYNGEGIFDEEWEACRPFTVADINAIHSVMPQNTTWGTDATHEFSMYFPKLRYFQGVVSEVISDADGKVTFTIVDEEGDAPATKVVDANYKEDQSTLKKGDKVVLSGDFGDVDGELQILTCDIESVEPAPVATLTAEPDVINFWGFSTTGESYYNTHSVKFHVTAENCTENITYVMQSSGKAKGSTSPRVTVATAGLYEANSGDLKLTCSSSKAADISDVVIIKSGEAEEHVTVNVKVIETQYNGEGIFDEEWDVCRPFTVSDINAIHSIMPQNTTWGTDATHEFSMYFPKLRYFQGVVSEVLSDADGKVTFTIVDEEGDAPATKVVDATYKEGQSSLKKGDKVVLSGDFGDVEGELQILTCSIESVEPAPVATLTAEPNEINFWGFTPATESYYYNTHSVKFHVTAENCTENITYVMQSSGKAKGSTSPRITVATAGLYEANSGDLKLTCSSSKAADISDVVIIKSGEAEEHVTVNVKVVETQYNGEGIFDEEWEACRPFTVADINAIHSVMPQNTTWGTDATHEFSMYFPKLRYFQGVVSEVISDADGKVTFTIVDEEGDAPATKVVDANYKEDQSTLKKGDKVVLSGDFGDVDGELQILTCDIESVETDVPAGIRTEIYGDSETAIYNINGMRVKTPAKGIYIVNGKKVTVK